MRKEIKMTEQIVRSKLVSYDDMPESLIDDMIDEMGKMPTEFFETQIIVTVIVTPLEDA